MSANSEKFFNLLEPVIPPKTFWDKIYDWFMTRARVVMIVVEVIVVLTFVGKIAIDNIGKNKMNELEKIQLELRPLEISNEAKFRDIQVRGEDYKKLWNKSSAYSEIISEIFSYINHSVDTLSIRIDKNSIIILGYEDLNALQSLETQLKSSPTFTNAMISINLEQRDVASDSGQFSLTVTIDDKNIFRERI